MTVTRWIDERLRRLADEIDHKGAPKAVGMSFTFERGRGIVIHYGRDRGCQLWYLGDDEYERAHTEAEDST